MISKEDKNIILKNVFEMRVGLLNQKIEHTLYQNKDHLKEFKNSDECVMYFRHLYIKTIASFLAGQCKEDLI